MMTPLPLGLFSKTPVSSVEIETSQGTGTCWRRAVLSWKETGVEVSIGLVAWQVSKMCLAHQESLRTRRHPHSLQAPVLYPDVSRGRPTLATFLG